MMLVVVAAVSFFVGFEGAQSTNAAARELESSQAKYLAEAGYSRASWLLAQNGTCAGYSDVPATTFEGHSYAVSVSPADGSPVTLASTGILSTGARRTLTRTVKAYKPPSLIILQPGPAGEDTYLRDGPSEDHNFGANGHLVVNNTGDEAVSLLRFDLSALPPGRTVSALLELNLESAQDLTNGVFDVHRITREWFEGESDDEVPTTPGATYRKYDGSKFLSWWSNAGGDYDASASATTTIGTAIPGFHQWDITSLVAAWVDGAAPNYGLLLRTQGSGNVEEVKFSSGDGVEGFTPRLRLVYACECGFDCGAPASFPEVLLVVGDPLNLDPQEDARRALIESWDYRVSLIDDSASPSAFASAMASAEAVYVPGTISEGELGDKLVSATVGVINEHPAVAVAMGISGTWARRENSVMNVTSNSHYITTDLPLGEQSVYSSAQASGLVVSSASGAQTLAEMNNVGPNWDPAVAAVETGAQLFDGSVAAGRRAQLPWDTFDVSALTSTGQSITRRAIEWGLGATLTYEPKAHWKLDDGAGSVALDSVGGHTGSLQNGPLWTADGKVGGALIFDGVDDQVNVSHSDDLNLVNGFTIAAWVRNDASSFSGSDRILSKESAGQNDNYWFSVQNRRLRLGVESDVFSPTSELNPGQWHHVAAAFDPVMGVVRIYVDGAEVLEANTTATLSPNTDPILIGSNWEGTKFWEGALDDVRLYGQALGADDIAGIAGLADGGTEVEGGEESGRDGGDVAGCDATVADDFETSDFSGDTGSLPWSGDWVEINESDGPGGGDVTVISLNQLNTEVLRIRDSDGGGEGAMRSFSGADHTTATLSLSFQRSGLDNEDDYVAVEVYDDASKSWSELARFAGPDGDTAFQSVSFDISGFLDSTTSIRFLGSSRLGRQDQVFLDDVEVCLGK